MPIEVLQTESRNVGQLEVPPRPSSMPTVMQLLLSLAPGGTERLAIEIVTRLADSFRMVVCCLDADGEWAGELRGIGVPVVSLHRSPGFHPSLGARVAAVAAQHHATVIHCHHYSPFVYGRIATLLNRRLGLVFTEHGRLSDNPPALKRRIANALLSRGSGRVFAVSEALKQHMMAEGFSNERVGVIYNGVDPGRWPTDLDRVTARRLMGIADDTMVIGTAARLDPVKDLGTLISAVAQVRTRGVPAALVIVGEGDERLALEECARDCGITDAVRLMGYQSDVRLLLSGFDIYVNSSVSEGVSLTILEAMAAGLPVVATGVGGTPEVVLEGSTGALVRARDASALAAAIEALAAHPARRREFGAAGRARVERLFTIDRMVADYAREYTRLEHH